MLKVKSSKFYNCYNFCLMVMQSLTQHNTVRNTAYLASHVTAVSTAVTS
jgi:hypothetical protein